MVALVERETQLEALIEAAHGSHGGIVLVTGEAGAGKTALIRALRDALDHRHRFRLGRCEPLSTPIPFGPLYEMLPELSSEAGTLLAEGGRRGDLFRAVVHEVTSERSVFVIEDVHFADEATIDLIRYLGRRVAESQSLLVCTYRAGEVDRDHPFRPVLGEIGTDAVRIELGVLSMNAVAALARGTDLDPIDLYAVTGGNPLFVVEMLANPGESLPVTISDAVLGRAHALPDTAWDALDQIALSPGGMPLFAIEPLGERWRADVDKAVAMGLLEVDAGRIRCRHELIRTALESHVPPGRRQTVHQFLFGLLSTHATNAADAVSLAHHAVHAQLPEEGIRWSLRAGRRASEDGAHREAVSHFTNALSFRDWMDPDTLLETCLALSYECYLTGALDRAAALGEELLAMSRTVSERGRALRWLSRLAWFGGRRDEALARGRTAVEVLGDPEADPHELAYAYSNMAQLMMLDRDAAGTEEWAEKALELARPNGDIEVVAHALNNLGSADPSPSRWIHIEESLELSLQHGLGEHAARAFTNLAYQATWCLQLERAEGFLNDGMDYTEAADLGTWWWYMRGNRSHVHLLRGRWDEAEADAAAILTAQVAPLMRHDALGTMARVRMRRGDEGSAEAVARHVETAREIGEHIRLVNAAAVVAEWCWLCGRRSDDHEQLIAEALAEAVERGDAWGAGSIGFWLLRGPVPGPEVTGPSFVEKEHRGDLCGASDELTSLGLVYEAAVTRARLGDEESVRSAFGVLDELGAEATIAAVTRDLRETGVPVPRVPARREQTNAAGITARQMEVLHCLAEGMSNADIADTLFISPKTAEHHVSAILSRLGVRSRTEAVARATAEGLLSR